MSSNQAAGQNLVVGSVAAQWLVDRGGGRLCRSAAAASHGCASSGALAQVTCKQVLSYLPLAGRREAHKHTPKVAGCSQWRSTLACTVWQLAPRAAQAGAHLPLPPPDTHTHRLSHAVSLNQARCALATNRSMNFGLRAKQQGSMRVDGVG